MVMTTTWIGLMTNVDWARIALDIRKYSSMREVSLRLGQHKDYLGQLSRNEIAEPKFSIGLSLLLLHREVCGEQANVQAVNHLPFSMKQGVFFPKPRHGFLTYTINDH